MSNPDVHVNFNGDTPNINVEADISPRGAEILTSPQTRSVEVETDRSGGISDMTGATASTAGVHGLAPAPAAGDQGKFLKGDGTWGNIPDASGKADKVTGATSGNFAGLDSNGNLTDSGSKASDFATQQYVETLAALPAMKDYDITRTAATSHTYTMGAGRGACLLMVAGSGGSRYWVGYVFRAGAANNLSIGEIAKGSNTSTSISGGTLTITFDSNTATDARVIHITGEKLT